VSRKRLGEILIVAGVLTEEQLQHGLKAQQRWGGPLGAVLVQEGLVSEELLARALSKQLNIPLVALAQVKIDPRVLQLVPVEVCKEFRVIGFQVQGKFLDVAMSDPMNMGVLDELRIRTRLNVRPHLATSSEIGAAIERSYARDMSIQFGNFPNQQAQVGMHDMPAGSDDRGPEIDALQRRLAALEALVRRDEDVIRKLMGLLVQKGVASREEILAAISS
jgi:hypothetical protein